MKNDRRAEDFRRMVVFGASITAGGWSTSRERCWASLLAGMINDFQSSPVEVFNAGIGANVISTRSAAYSYASKPVASERLDPHVIAHKPDLVVIGEFAINDARGGTPPDIFKEELVKLIHRLRETVNPVIVLLGTTHIVDSGLGRACWGLGDKPVLMEFNSLIAEVALEERCLFADTLAAMNETDWMVHLDGVHVNDLGHRIIANRIFEVLAQNCSCLAKQTRKIEKTSPRWRDESTLTADDGK